MTYRNRQLHDELTHDKDTAEQTHVPTDLTAQIIAYENGELGFESVVELFQHLVDSGLAWELQGSYGRTAQRLLDDGFVHHG